MAYLGTVVIVPGIGGNDLYTQRTFFGFGPVARLWLDPAAMTAFGWRLLGLAADGHTPDVPLTGPLIPGGPLAYYYTALADELGSRGWRVVGAEVDWRLELSRNVDALVRLLERNVPFAPIHLLAHSRGGLLCRAAMPAIIAAGLHTVIGWSGGLGVPHYGSWEAAGLLAGWNSTANFLALVLERVAGIVSAGAVLGPLRHVLTSWPAAYQLLPNPTAPGVSAGEIDAVYNPATWQSQDVPVSATWLAAARAAWPSLGLIPQSIDWFDVAGYGLSTPHALPAPYRLNTSRGFTWDVSGDSTVRTDWALQPGRRKILAPTSHGALVYDRRVIEAVSNAMRGGLREDVLISGPILQ